MSNTAIRSPSRVRDFLGELALAIHRFLIYPADHPLLAENAATVARLLDVAVGEAPSLDITVTRTRLVIAGERDPEGPGHHDVAGKLREMGVGGLRLGAGATQQDIQALLEFLSSRSRSGLTTLDADVPVEGSTLVEVRPVSLAGLEISWEDGGGGSDRLAHLWLALDGAVAGGGATPSGAGEGTVWDLEEGRDEPAVNRLAQGLTATARSPAGAALAVGYLRQILRTVGSSSGDHYASMVRRRLTGLIRKLDPATIRELAAGAGQPADTASFMADVGLLDDEAVAKVLRSVANPTARSFAGSLARLFGKMARQSAGTDGQVRDMTQKGLRKGLLGLLDGWALEDPNPEAYGAALDRISLSLRGLEDEWSVGGREPERILQMSLELDHFGPVSERAVEYLLFRADAGMTTLVTLIESEGDGNAAVRGISRMLSEPDRILALATAEDVDDATLQSVVARVGDRALEPLLEVLAKAEARAIRRRIFDALVGFGAQAAEAALRRLPDDRWYVTRNLLALARNAGYHFPWFDPDPYMQSEEIMIRREAYRLAYLDPKRRTTALEAALDEEDESILEDAMAELERGVPSVVAQSLSVRIVDSTEPAARRAAAIRGLRSSRAPVALAALLEVATYRTRVLRRRKIRKPGEVVSAAVRVLREQWDRNPAAQAVLSQARRSGHFDGVARDPGADARV